MTEELIKGVRVVTTKPAADDVQELASREGIHAWRVDLSKISSKTDLLETIGKALSFPDYYGRNWDALSECLRDFDEGKGWLIIFDHADTLLALPRQDLTTLEAILSDAANFWSAEGRIFGALFVGGPTLREALELAPPH